MYRANPHNCALLTPESHDEDLRKPCKHEVLGFSHEEILENDIKLMIQLANCKEEHRLPADIAKEVAEMYFSKFRFSKGRAMLKMMPEGAGNDSYLCFIKAMMCTVGSKSAKSLQQIPKLLKDTELPTNLEETDKANIALY